MANVDPFPRLSDFLLGLVEPANGDAQTSTLMGEQQSMYVEQLSVDLPFELSLNETETGELELLASPPSQTTSTTVMPVFHRVKVTISLDEPSGFVEEHPYGN